MKFPVERSESRNRTPRASKPVGGDHDNPWAAILTEAVQHPDVHVQKSVRSLWFASHRFSWYPKGYLTVPSNASFEGTDIPKEAMMQAFTEMNKQLGCVDGSLFLRAASLVLEAVDLESQGIHREDEIGSWDFNGIGFDENWTNWPRQYV